MFWTLQLMCVFARKKVHFIAGKWMKFPAASFLTNQLFVLSKHHVSYRHINPIKCCVLLITMMTSRLKKLHGGMSVKQKQDVFSDLLGHRHPLLHNFLLCWLEFELFSKILRHHTLHGKYCGFYAQFWDLFASILRLSKRSLHGKYCGFYASVFVYVYWRCWKTD